MLSLGATVNSNPPLFIGIGSCPLPADCFVVRLELEPVRRPRKYTWTFSPFLNEALGREREVSYRAVLLLYPHPRRIDTNKDEWLATEVQQHAYHTSVPVYAAVVHRGPCLVPMVPGIYKGLKLLLPKSACGWEWPSLDDSPHEYCRVRSPELAPNQPPLAPDRAVKLPAVATWTATAEIGLADPLQADTDVAVGEQQPRGRFLETAAAGGVEPKPITNAGVGALVWPVNRTASALSHQRRAKAPARRFIDLIAMKPSPRSTQHEWRACSCSLLWLQQQLIDTSIVISAPVVICHPGLYKILTCKLPPTQQQQQKQKHYSCRGRRREEEGRRRRRGSIYRR